MKRFQGKFDGKFFLEAFIAHLANSTGIKVSPKVILVILSVVLTAVTRHGSNDDSDDKKFWKPSPLCPSNIIAWLPSVQDSWGILLTRLIFKWECFYKGQRQLTKDPWPKTWQFKIQDCSELVACKQYGFLKYATVAARQDFLCTFSLRQSLGTIFKSNVTVMQTHCSDWH